MGIYPSQAPNPGDGSGGSGSSGSDQGSSTIQITPHYTDNSSSENYNQFKGIRNDTLVDDILIRNDVGFNGSSSHLQLRVKADKGDVVTIDLQCIDKAVYNYFGE